MLAESVNGYVAEVEAAYRDLHDAVTAPGAASLPAGDGSTVQELLGHIAFSEEASAGVIIAMWRGEAMPEGWGFGSGYVPVPGAEWPRANEHYRREAAWAAAQPWGDVLQRWQSAHAYLLKVLASVTEEEAEEHCQYLAGIAEHLRAHLASLRTGGASRRHIPGSK